MSPAIGSRWLAKGPAAIWIVRGVTARGVFLMLENGDCTQRGTWFVCGEFFAKHFTAVSS